MCEDDLPYYSYQLHQEFTTLQSLLINEQLMKILHELAILSSQFQNIFWKFQRSQ